MNALKVQKSLDEIERGMTELAPHRSPALFNEFLINGYTAITLSSVPQAKFCEVLQAKLCLGTLITLYDDFADRPAQSNPQLLEILYQLSFGRRTSIRTLNPRNRQVVEFAHLLFETMNSVLDQLPNYYLLIEILNFDLGRFYSANQFSSLLMANPYMNNAVENRLYAHHNMGMVLAAMMDLMATDKVELSELGTMREVFLMGQRMGRIFNVLTTRKRENKEGDITGELSAYTSEREFEVAEKALRQEIQDLSDKIKTFDTRITTFSVEAYLNGLTKVRRLHETMEGIL